MGLLPPDALKVQSGRILLEGRNLLELSQAELRRLRAVRMSMVFQEPMTSLNPVQRVGDQIAEVIHLHDPGCSKAESRARVLRMLADVGLPDPPRIHASYPHELSGGQRQRIMIAMALILEPRLLIADEPTTALDVTTQAQLLDLLRHIQAERRLALVLITHDIGVVASMADKIAVMYAGRLVEYGDAVGVLTDPDHPYTAGLLASIPDPQAGAKQPFQALPGLPPDLSRVGKGCRFAERCALAEERCGEVPRLVRLKTSNGGWRASSCWKRPHHELDRTDSRSDESKVPS